MNKINAIIVADSINLQGERITSYILTYPRFIHAELMTHRMFSRNSASSRAIPFEKMLKMVKEDPFIPIAWQKDHKGMQGTEYIVDKDEIRLRELEWLKASNQATMYAKHLNNPYGVTKQLCNRLLEPFMWHTVLVTATEYDNFFELRCPKFASTTNGPFRSKEDAMEKINESNGYLTDKDDFDYYQWQAWNKSGAEIHIQALAEAMWVAMNESTPKLLQAEEWHIPFGDKIFSEDSIEEYLMKQPGVQWVTAEQHDKELEKIAIKIAIARCARLSYMTFDGEINYAKDIALHDQLLESKHMSPFEHCAKAMDDEEYHSFIKGRREIKGIEPVQYVQYDPNSYGWCNNFKGFIPYRYMIDNGN